jgi:hypothetical protein
VAPGAKGRTFRRVRVSLVALRKVIVRDAKPLDGWTEMVSGLVFIEVKVVLSNW